MRSRAIYLISLIMITGLLLSACGSASSGKSQTTYEVSPSFREIYEKLGGESVLGPAISVKFDFENYQCQYAVNALMCLNPQATDASRLFFYPLGDAMGIQETPDQSPAQSGSTVVDGYTIYDEFLPLYSQMSGQFVGKPLTQAHINYSQQRIEQYFENVGFYRKFSDPAGSVHLLAYGAYNCDSQCKYTPVVEASILNTTKASQDQPLLAGLSALADTSILGQPLTQPYIASDGMEEQVYENAVVYAPVNNLSQAKLRPLSTLLNIPQTEPGPRKYSSSDGMVFYTTQGSNGYHVPLVFDQFIASHGGVDYSGNPIDEVYQFSETIYRQCFVNYCLDYDAAAGDDSKVKMSDLGRQYVQQISNTSTSDIQPTELDSGAIHLAIDEESKTIAPDAQQNVEIQVTQSRDGQPVTNITATLTMTLPDGTQKSIAFPATGLDGRSSATLPAMKKVSNGTILEYKVCLDGIPGTPVCATESYVIWAE